MACNWRLQPVEEMQTTTCGNCRGYLYFLFIPSSCMVSNTILETVLLVWKFGDKRAQDFRFEEGRCKICPSPGIALGDAYLSGGEVCVCRVWGGMKISNIEGGFPPPQKTCLGEVSDNYLLLLVPQKKLHLRIYLWILEDRANVYLKHNKFFRKYLRISWMPNRRRLLWTGTRVL